MGGSSGGVIIRQNARTVLQDPVVHGALPADKRAAVDPILAKEEADWTAQDKRTVSKVHAWAMCNLP